MPTIVNDDLTTEVTSEPMQPDDLLVAIALSAFKNGKVTWDEVAATYEAAGRGDLLEMAKDLGVGEDEGTDPSLDDPEPDEDPDIE